MEQFVNFALYFIACVCVLVPVCGLGLAPGVVVNLEVAAILGTLSAQLSEKGTYKALIENKGNSFPVKQLVPTLEKLQEKV